VSMWSLYGCHLPSIPTDICKKRMTRLSGESRVCPSRRRPRGKTVNSTAVAVHYAVQYCSIRDVAHQFAIRRVYPQKACLDAYLMGSRREWQQETESREIHKKGVVIIEIWSRKILLTYGRASWRSRCRCTYRLGLRFLHSFISGGCKLIYTSVNSLSHFEKDK
jgi:hypothetical protein